MLDTIYIERELLSHPRAKELCMRFPDAPTVVCERYGEVFNRNSQNFRLQKQNPSLIIANKFDRHVLPVPEGYGIGGQHNFYFSHMLNCLYDCRYCFLQGMYRSANYVLFVNYEDFEVAMLARLRETPDEPVWFFSGYDCDSLALDPVSAFVEHFLPFFARHPRAHLELRSKSTQIRSLLATEPLPNVVTAFSFTPQEHSTALEHRVPSVQRRLDSMVQLQRQGWPIGLRFDPLIYCDNYKALYRDLFEQVFARVDASRIHSVSLGPFRLPRGFMKKMVQLYPDERLFAGPLQEVNGMVSYERELEQTMSAYCASLLRDYVTEDRLFPCPLS